MTEVNKFVDENKEPLMSVNIVITLGHHLIKYRYKHLSMRAFLIVVEAVACGASVILKILSITFSSVAVVSIPQKAAQSFTNSPAAKALLPRFTVPAWSLQRIITLKKGTKKFLS